MTELVSFRYKINEDVWINMIDKKLPLRLEQIKWYQQLTAQALGPMVTVATKG